ncbi:MAG: bifunctional glutamate N-acetyltransferase/amino-acid acetyltransferase ArgJ [bacterium]|nr:bifunctional glutamate N-acetyltransferase/amino-acid acetyltransferase ArgJ [bacterium]
MVHSIEVIAEGGVATPAGFKAGGLAAGIKKSGAPDLAALVSDTPCAAGGVFTTNALKGASLMVTRERVQLGRAQAVWVNSGNANSCTGEDGLQAARELSAYLAQRLGIDAALTLPNSTGVIGVPLPLDKIRAGMDSLAGSLSAAGGPAFARAIMTTDTVPKSSARRVNVNGKTFSLGASAKGAGMIHPNMATMLTYITTDAALEPGFTQNQIAAACAKTFNRFTIDGDTSCCDTVLLLANGASGVSIEPGSEEAAAFAEALHDLCWELTRKLARDGEGVTKAVLIRVEGAPGDAEAVTIARSIATSPLVKTALHAADPNWGRIVNAAGYSGAAFDIAKIDVFIGETAVMKRGAPVAFSESEVHAYMQQDELIVRLALNQGAGEGFYLTTDFSKEYVDINADYRNRT